MAKRPKRKPARAKVAKPSKEVPAPVAVAGTKKRAAVAASGPAKSKAAAAGGKSKSGKGGVKAAVVSVAKLVKSRASARRLAKSRASARSSARAAVVALVPSNAASGGSPAEVAGIPLVHRELPDPPAPIPFEEVAPLPAAALAESAALLGSVAAADLRPMEIEAAGVARGDVAPVAASRHLDIPEQISQAPVPVAPAAAPHDSDRLMSLTGGTTTTLQSAPRGEAPGGAAGAAPAGGVVGPPAAPQVPEVAAVMVGNGSAARGFPTRPDARFPAEYRMPLPAEPERTTEPPPGPSWKPEPSEPAVHTTAATPIPPPRPANPDAPAPSPEPPAPPLLFECGWEVCWQLGGIYTVLKTKAVSMLQTWGDRYTLIGPYNPNTAALEFEEMPASGIIAQALDRLREQGIPCHYGRWLIPGRPRVILLDYRARFRYLDQDKYLMWADHYISTPPGDGEVNEVVAFGFTVAQFFQELSSLKGDTPVLAHFHEWMGGVAIPRIAHLKLPVQTIFTTHATLLGRYLASDHPNFYEHLPYIDPDAEAQKYQIYPRYQIEKAAAHASTVFTTVSEVTAVEASKLLGRMPEFILPNGLNIQRFSALHEFQNLHRTYKERIHEFVMGHFFPSYTFDLDNTLYFFTAGRYEYKNKGLDLYIEALHRLNQKLRHLPDRPTVVAFIVTKAAVRNISVDVLRNHAMFEELRQTCVSLQEQMGHRLFLSAATGRVPTFGELLPDDAQVRLKRAMHAWRTSRQPAYVTHDLAYEAEDPVLKHLRHRWFFNAADDPVKMVFHPEFVTATSPLLGLDYEQFVRGCHMGIFPSYYEPWGYTPMECIALGVPSITTDLSGFGAYVNRHVTKNAAEGVYVLDRAHQGFDESAEGLAEHLLGFCKLNRRQRIELRNRTERLGELFDWSALVRHYHEAHALALERAYGASVGKLEVRMV